MASALHYDETSFDWINWFTEPMILIGRNGELLSLNSAGRISIESGFPLRLQNAVVSGATVALDRVLKAAIQNKTRLSIIERHPETNAVIALWGNMHDNVYCLRLSPLLQNGELFANVDLGESFKLTPAERRILSMIFANLSADQIAQKLKLSIETVRTHRKRIYAKVGVNGRSDMLIQFARAFVL